ncbi:hypothetical protein JW613_00590 [Streptomyces smyrnaeus]|uniref:Ricin B lectin domain-containing protein n=1 Tax=Streptomyces smyrnaeus TaxID=1387713 RepID=A0ABS3XNA9_9ACTN|nr:hypothetical protein [Streptomyces smyrnaeus]MBO8196816.1 hypothetical protein [Streptomyces smyrnaeus]
MFARTARRILTALAATALTGTALAAAPAAADSSQRAVPSGEFIAVSQVTGNYMLPDDTKGNAGTYLQVYPSTAPKGWKTTWRFDRVATSNGRAVYQLQSSAGACATNENGENSIVYLRDCSNRNKDQWWLLEPVPGTDPQNPDYGIVSYRDEDLALTARGEGDTYIDLKRMWGDHPSQRQGWHFYAA